MVGVLGYGPSDKIGEDVGELINHPPIGVKVTPYSSRESILEMDADCVLWTGILPFANRQQLLEMRICIAC